MWLTSLINGLRDFGKTIWPDLKRVGGTVLGELSRGVGEIVKNAKIFVNTIFSEYQKNRRELPITTREETERKLQEVNAEIAFLQKRHREHNGNSSSQDWQRFNELKAKRAELNKELDAIDQITSANDIVEKEKDFKPISIDNINAHILQYHVGQNACNKICQCGRPMVLQWDRKKITAGVQDFFWGCSGYYVELQGKHACILTERLSLNDLDLFANLNKPEFEISSSTLTSEAINPTKAKKIRQALDHIRGKHRSQSLGIAVYRCPIHGESLQLKRKMQANEDILDEYFLGCPRWLPQNAGCNFLMKLKSAAQISSVLDKEEGIGILGI